MENYRHILMAADYSDHCHLVAKKARQLTALYGAELSLVHVLDNIPMPQMQYGTVISLNECTDNERLELEKIKFVQWVNELAIPIENCWLIWGMPKREITVFAAQKKVDLIVVGSHGRHGFALLLGSTANGVLHHAQCDVLSVRLRD